MDLKSIKDLIKYVAKSGTSEVSLEMDDVKITIKNEQAERENQTLIQQVPMQQPMGQNPMPMQAQQQVQEPQAPAQTTGDANQADDNYITVKSPIIGTFYRKPSPDKPAYVEVGSQISEGDVLCTIEAMKLFNEIESEVSGKIVKVLVDDASPVEFDQPLFLVDPA
ncbi:MAG: acetyl-CoA carboxylase biotin carboxyl carrier protein [Flavobacteriaceae bacterium]|nr:acetyl-CoA carboxylase biotin carboxyl carrier protein [Flavobacteriaceae bacterium]